MKFLALVLIFLLPALSPTQAGPEMEVIFLGTGGPRPTGRAASCNLILINGKPRLVIDAGSGAFTRIGELGLNLQSLDLIL